MRHTIPVALFVALSMGTRLISAIALAQNPADPLNPFGGEGIDFRQLAPAEPSPEGPLPADAALGGQLALPALAGVPAVNSDALCRCVGEESSAEASARIRRVLALPLKESGIEFTDQPLEEVVGLLQEEYGIPIKVDRTALNEAGIQSNSGITVNIHGVTLGAALRLMLRENNLHHTMQDEVLLITTPDAEEKRLKTCVYDVRDVLRDTKKGNDYDSLIDSIVACIATETWAENGGGEAEIRPLPPGFLIIAQTEAVHDQIRGLLATVRELKSRPVAAGATAALVPVPDDEVVTQSYRLNFGKETVTDELRTQVRELIVKALPDERWDGRLTSGQPVVLAVLNDRLVVRHKPAVQEKVEAMLAESGIATMEAKGFCGPVGGGGRSGLAKKSDESNP